MSAASTVPSSVPSLVHSSSLPWSVGSRVDHHQQQQRQWDANQRHSDDDEDDVEPIDILVPHAAVPLSASFRAPRAPVAAWFSSEYLSATGTIMSKETNNAPPTIDARTHDENAASNISRAAKSSSRDRADRECGGDTSPRLELTPSGVVAPIFPFMGLDAECDWTSGQIGATTATFGGWSNAADNDHDQPRLRFLPEERLEPFEAAAAKSQNAAAAAANAAATRRAVNEVYDAPNVAVRPALPPRAGSAHSDPQYSPSLLSVTAQWWDSCATSHFLVQPAANNASAISTDDASLPTPPLLTHSAYVHIRMLVCMALLPPHLFEQRLPTIAKMVEYEFIEEAAGDARTTTTNASRSSSSSSSSPLLGLTLPMFHSSMCHLAAAWTSAATVAQYSEFLSNLYTSITEEVEESEHKEDEPKSTHATHATPTRTHPTSALSPSRVPFSPTSPISPATPHTNSALLSPSPHSAPPAPVSPPPPPRRFQRLPSSVLAALTLAAEEVSLERDREREAAAARRPRRKKMDRDVREAMAKRSAEMIGRSNSTSPQRRRRDKSARDDDGGAASSRKKKRSKEGRSASKEKSARLDDSDDDARARRLARKREAKAQRKLSRAAAAKARRSPTDALLDVSEAIDEDDDDDDDDDASPDSQRKESLPSEPTSPRLDPTSSARFHFAPKSAATPMAAGSPRHYMSSADIRRSARTAVDAPPTPSPPLHRAWKDGNSKYPSSRVPPRSSTRAVSLGDADADSSEADAADDIFSGWGANEAPGTSESRGSSAGQRSQHSHSQRSETRAVADAADPPPDPYAHVRGGSVGGSSGGRIATVDSTNLAPSSSPASVAAAKQSRILALQQQALMHRARIATGRTHSGHVLPAYITTDDAVAVTNNTPAYALAQQTQSAAHLSSLSSPHSHSPPPMPQPPYAAVSKPTAVAAPAAGAHTRHASHRFAPRDDPISSSASAAIPTSSTARLPARAASDESHFAAAAHAHAHLAHPHANSVVHLTSLAQLARVHDPSLAHSAPTPPVAMSLAELEARLKRMGPISYQTTATGNGAATRARATPAAAQTNGTFMPLSGRSSVPPHLQPTAAALGGLVASQTRANPNSKPLLTSHAQIAPHASSSYQFHRAQPAAGALWGTRGSDGGSAAASATPPTAAEFALGLVGRKV